jgi:hypothetical protein
MATEKRMNGRFLMKHDTEENWVKATGFTPLPGEIIVYDADSNYSYPRIKIGDGTKNVNILPFIDDILWAQIASMNQIVANDDGNGNITLESIAFPRAELEEY